MPEEIIEVCCYAKDVFQCLLIDTGAADYSSGDYEQFLAYKRVNKNAGLDVSTARSVDMRFGVRERLYSIGSINLTRLLESVTPFLFSSKDLDLLKVYFDNTRNVHIGLTKGQAMPHAVV